MRLNKAVKQIDKIVGIPVFSIEELFPDKTDCTVVTKELQTLSHQLDDKISSGKQDIILRNLKFK